MDEQKKKDLRLLLVGDSMDTNADGLIELLFKMATTRLLFLIANVRKGFGLPPLDPLPTVVPEGLAWILDEVIIRRFNRIGSEGYQSQSVEGHSVTFSTDDFSEFLTDISGFYEPPNYSSHGGRLVMW